METIEIAKAFEKSILDPDQEIKESPICLEILQNDERIPIYTLGNFSAIIGKAKARKSFFVSLIMGIMASGKQNDIFQPRIKKNCILFDTEQALYHVHKFAKRSVKIAGSKDKLIFCALRPYDTEQRIEIIEHGIYNTDDLGFVVIDGVRDLVTDINNPNQATKIGNLLLKWTAEANIHIINVIHQNKADLNARGHIGSEIMFKSETVLSIEKKDMDGIKSIVKPEFTRGPEFNEFAFYIDNGLPTLMEHTPTEIPF